MIVGVDHGYYSMKTKNFCFPSGLIQYEHEPYTRRDVLEIDGKYYVCGTGRQPLQKNKIANGNYYLLTLAAVAKEIHYRKAPRREEVTLAAGLPLTGFGREKKPFKDYLLGRKNPVVFRYEGEDYEITFSDVRLFPQGYSAIAMHPELVSGEPSVVLADVGGWTVDLMRIDNGVPNAATCRSLEMGMIRCLDEIMEQVRRNTGLSVTDVQVERVLMGSVFSIEPSVREIIQEYGRRYTGKVLSAVVEAGYDLRAVPSVFIGGGAGILERNVTPQDRLCRAVMLPDVHLNAAGYERIAGQMVRP